MSEEQMNKDYGEYFSALEKSIQNKSANVEKPIRTSPTRKRIKVKKRRRRIRPAAVILSALIVAAVVAAVIFIPRKTAPKSEPSIPAKTQKKDVKKDIIKKVSPISPDSLTAEVDAEIQSESVIVINLKTEKVVCARNSDEKMFPASTTKIMTLLVAAENMKDKDDTFKMTLAITDPLYRAEATVAGFAAGEEVSVIDMLYGTILPSGADAAMGLAEKLFGSEEKMVEQMNNKAKELSLKNTHFTNVSGLHDQNHYSTVSDMATILRAAMNNELCREILSTYQYTTAATDKHPGGILLSSTLFSYMYGTEPEGANIMGGKTGYTAEAGYCIATFGQTDGGTPFLAVGFKAPSKWPAIYDQIKLYSKYANDNQVAKSNN